MKQQMIWCVNRERGREQGGKGEGEGLMYSYNMKLTAKSYFMCEIDN